MPSNQFNQAISFYNQCIKNLTVQLKNIKDDKDCRYEYARKSAFLDFCIDMKNILDNFDDKEAFQTQRDLWNVYGQFEFQDEDTWKSQNIN